QHVTQYDGGKAERTHEQAETTQRLERGEVGVLDRVEFGEARGGALDIGAEVGGALLEVASLAVDEQESIPLLLRKQADEVRVGHHQLYLKDAVGQRGNKTQANLLLACLDDELVAKTLVKYVGHRVGVSNHRHDASSQIPVQKQPRVGAFGVGGGQRRLKREAAAVDECLRRAEDARVR